MKKKLLTVFTVIVIIVDFVLIYNIFYKLPSIPKITLGFLKNNNNIETVRIYGENRYATAEQVCKEGWPRGSENLIIARSDNYIDAFIAAPLAAKLNAPILLTPPDRLSCFTRDEIKRLKPKSIILIGDEKNISQSVSLEIERNISSKDTEIIRIGRGNTLETALMISNIIEPGENKSAVITSTRTFPEIVVASSLAAKLKIPLFLIDDMNQANQIETKLNRFKIEKLYFIGDRDIISDQIYLWFFRKGYFVYRIFGDTRYTTCQNVINFVLRENLPSMNSLFCVNGEDFADSLSTVALAAKQNYMLFLVPPRQLNSDIYKWLENKRNSINIAYLFGDISTISKETEYAIQTGEKSPGPPEITQPKSGEKVKRYFDIYGLNDKRAEKIILYKDGEYLSEVNVHHTVGFVFESIEISGDMARFQVFAYNKAGKSESSNKVYFGPEKYIIINTTTQKVIAYKGGELLWDFPACTGMPGYETPTGNFQVYNHALRPYSEKWKVYMPYWTAFTPSGSHGMHALDGTWYYPSLGQAGISHGCVRLSHDAAIKIYYWADIGIPVYVK